jgi:hypothetical protein
MTMKRNLDLLKKKMEASGAAFSGHKICTWKAKVVEFPDVKNDVDQLAELNTDTEC